MRRHSPAREMAGLRLFLGEGFHAALGTDGQRLGFAIAAFLEPEILVVDEVLAVGDAEFQKKAIGFTKAKKTE